MRILVDPDAFESEVRSEPGDVALDEVWVWRALHPTTSKTESSGASVMTILKGDRNIS